jgi:hypothetical protein
VAPKSPGLFFFVFRVFIILIYFIRLCRDILLFFFTEIGRSSVRRIAFFDSNVDSGERDVPDS